MNKLCLLLLCCINLFQASGQPGSLDPTFGNNGTQKTAFFTNLNLLSEQGRIVLPGANGDFFVVVQISNSTRIAKYLPDGKLDSSYGIAGYSNAVNLYNASAALMDDKILMVGRTTNSGSYDFALVSYTADGALDASFGENGIVTTDFNNSYDAATSIAIQGNKIIVAGYATNPHNGNYDFALARYISNGDLDASFGMNGKATTDFKGASVRTTSIALQGDNIVVAGNAERIIDGWGYSVSDFALARYTADGVLDTTFGENGKLTTDIGTDNDEVSSITLQGDKIIVVGNIAFSNFDFALVRYTADGALDTSFGVNGIVTTDFNAYNRNNETSSVIVQGDKIIVAGYADDISNGFIEDFALIRYNVNGTLDSSFGVNGIVTTDFNNAYDKANSIIIQGDKIIVGGSTATAYDSDLALARYTADGTLDASFGENGKLTGYYPSAGSTYFTSTVIQGNKIIAAGYSINNNKGSSDFVLARYASDGRLDSSFGKNGKVITDFNSDYDEATSIVLQGDKIVVGGNTFNSESNWDISLARYTADGALDSSFGENGKVTADLNKYYDWANSIALQGDKILVAGQTYDYNSDSYFDFVLARFTADGRLDSSFGANGKVTTSFSPNTDGATSIAVQGNKIIIAGYGYTPDYQSGWEFALARYTADGVLDSSFGVNGKVYTDFNNSSDEVQSIVLQGDKILVAGETSYNDFALARYTANGVLDSSFGENGKVTTDFGYDYERANSIALQGDKIIVGGSSTAYGDFALARYTADGALDASFGKNGKTITQLGGYSFLEKIALHENRLYAVGSLSLFTGETYGVVAAYRLEAPAPTISIADVTVSESKKLAIVTVRLSAPANQIVRVHFTTRNKTAVGNQDYIPISGPLFFIPGINTTAKIIIPIIDDNKKEGNEQFEILLTNAYNATIQDSVAVVTILDNDDALITKQQSTSLHIIASPNPSVHDFTVQLQGTNLKQSVSVLVYDISGRLLEKRTNINIGQSLRLGEQYKAGTYIIEAVQGSQKVQTKVIKIGK